MAAKARLEKEMAKRHSIKRLKTPADHEKSMLEAEAALELGEAYQTDEEAMETDRELRFVPHPPPRKENTATPIGRKHIVGPHLLPAIKQGQLKFT